MTEAQRFRNRQYRQRRRARLLAAGLCTSCGQNPPVDGGKTCKLCRDYYGEHKREWAGAEPGRMAEYPQGRKVERRPGDLWRALGGDREERPAVMMGSISATWQGD